MRPPPKRPSDIYTNLCVCMYVYVYIYIYIHLLLDPALVLQKRKGLRDRHLQMHAQVRHDDEDVDGTLGEHAREQLEEVAPFGTCARASR